MGIEGTAPVKNDIEAKKATPKSEDSRGLGSTDAQKKEETPKPQETSDSLAVA